MDESRLRQIEVRLDCTTPGPWHHIDDDDTLHMTFHGVATDPTINPAALVGGKKLVCGTLVQSHTRIAHDSGRWDGDANFIAHARQDIPDLVFAVRERDVWLGRFVTDSGQFELGRESERGRIITWLRSVSEDHAADLLEAQGPALLLPAERGRLNLLSVLKEIEWGDSDETGSACPLCSCYREDGHADTCRLAKALRERA